MSNVVAPRMQAARRGAPASGVLYWGRPALDVTRENATSAVAPFVPDDLVKHVTVEPALATYLPAGGAPEEVPRAPTFLPPSGSRSGAAQRPSARRPPRSAGGAAGGWGGARRERRRRLPAGSDHGPGSGNSQRRVTAKGHS